MQTNNYPLKTGTITIDGHSVQINDQILSQRRAIYIQFFVFTILGFTNIYRYVKEGDLFYIITGGLLITLFILLALVLLQRTTLSEFSLSEVNKIRMRKNFTNDPQLTFFLKTGKKRVIVLHKEDTNQDQLLGQLQAANLPIVRTGRGI